MLVYEPDDHINQYEQLSYQPNITEALESKKYSIFIDIGAEIGLFSLVGSIYCKKVISYEASPFLFGVLLYNMRYSKNVECRYGYVGCAGNVPKMYDQIDMIVNGATKEYNIPILELDIDLKDYINTTELILIKMDIEGNELNALKVAQKLIQNKNIHWIIDVHNPIPMGDIVNYFKNRIMLLNENVLSVK